MRKFLMSLLAAFLFSQGLIAQSGRWQQKVKYTMGIDMNVTTNQFTGKQKLEYTNNSPDTLTRVFYHLYFNAFQPGSMMDERSRHLGTIKLGNRPDWDGRVRDRISKLKPEEIGYQKIISLKLNGKPQTFQTKETILEVTLDKPILPGAKVVFDMEFEAQVPLQVRRSGRDNPSTKVRYSMSQWYPKMCEYDEEGWHPTPYVAREFYGIWGDFDVRINIDKNYILGGTGYLQNANEIGYGYETAGTKVPAPKGDKLSWHFLAPNVHDFVWAADPEFKHITRQVKKDLTLHLLYKKSASNSATWEKILDDAEKALPFIEKTFGEYPYKQYSFIHGGDGGMEYPMATLLASPGAWLHEWMHSWYQMMLATNESLYAWMDEGFTSYADSRVTAFLQGNNPPFPQEDSYDGYYALAKSGLEEPLSTHADHFNTNYAYSLASYSKGAVFMEQLGYIVGAEVRDRILLDYYKQWRFHHPNLNDFMKIAEKASQMKLDWYKEYWVYTTKTIDYAIDSLWQEGKSTRIRLRRIGDMPMPIDLQVTSRDGTNEIHYIPLYDMFGEKPAEAGAPANRKVHQSWKWTHETYVLEVDKKLTDITQILIDPTRRMADIEPKNNKLDLKWPE